jgi:sugar phosphate isomerase/epimerase
MNRRHFIAACSALSAAASSARMLSASAAPAHSRVLGLQLFTVMTLLEKDFEGTLKAIADIGYREVETIASFGRDPKQVRALLDKYGLVSPSQHLVPGSLYDVFSRFTRHELSVEEVKRQWLREMSVERVTPIIEEGIARARVLGQKYLVWQIIWPEQMQTRELLDGFCHALNTAGALCTRAGLGFNYHNHAEEFKPQNGYVPYDVILASTDPKNVKLEMDVYWAYQAKIDPVKYFLRNPGRYVQCHLKDSTANGDFATVGRGVLDFPKILKACRKAGIEHYYVEYDRSDDPMAVCRDAFRYLQPLL